LRATNQFIMVSALKSVPGMAESSSSLKRQEQQQQQPMNFVLATLKGAEKSRNNNAPNDAGGTFPPLFFDAQNDDFFKSAQRVSCRARVVPLINRVPRFFPPRQPRARRKRKLTHRVSIPSPIYQQTRREGKRKSEKERTRRPPRPG